MLIDIISAGSVKVAAIVMESVPTTYREEIEVNCIPAYLDNQDEAAEPIYSIDAIEELARLSSHEEKKEYYQEFHRILEKRRVTHFIFVRP